MMDEKSNLIVGEESKVELQERTGLEKEHESKANDFELESYLKSSSLGFFLVFLLIVVGLATAVDAVELFSVAFVLPIAGQDLDLTTARKGWVTASLFTWVRWLD